MSLSLPPVSLVKGYLEAQGWHAERLAVPDLTLFVFDDEELGEIEIVMPAHSAVVDADRRIAQALRTLSQLEDRPIDAVLAEINGFRFDIVETTVPASRYWRESIALRVAESFVTGGRNLMLHTAAAELAGRSENVARDGRVFADNCRFGHTFRGSFGFRILSPVRRTDHPVLSEPLLARRIVQRLQHGIAVVQRATDQTSVGLLIKDARFGLSASAYDDLAELLEHAETDEVTFRFVLSHGEPALSLSRGPLALRTAAAPMLRSAAEKLRSRPVAQLARVSGRVVRLSSQFLPNDLFHREGREIDVLWNDANFGRTRVRVRLTPADYLRAIEAHEEGREVIVDGLLQPFGAAGFSIDEPAEFSVGDVIAG